MLVELLIENFAIIQQLKIDFTSGLVILTGETGAGKSILLDALQMVLGGRTEVEAIRSGSDRAYIEATFRLVPSADPDQPHPLIAYLEKEGYLDDPEYVVLSRELRREGRSISRLNGRSVSQGILKEIGASLVDIHGQSDHLSLLDARQHLTFLDRYAGNQADLSTYQSLFRQIQLVQQELESLRQSEQTIAQQIDLLTFQVQEIEAAALKPDEEQDLRRERDRLANAENLLALLQQSLQLLEEGSPESPSISDQVAQLVHLITALARLDPSQGDTADQLTTLQDALTEVTRSLQYTLDSMEINPRRLEQVEKRLDLIHNLKRKYGATIDAVLLHAWTSRQKLESFTTRADRIQELETKKEVLQAELLQIGNSLTQSRQQTADRLSTAIESELNDLKMSGARFAVDIHPLSGTESRSITRGDGQEIGYSQLGLDQIEFLVAPNIGEGLKPLVKIASGGETSRLMLALKSVLAQADAIPTLVFDEIDQGIGGKVGAMVGEKLWRLARFHQVLCVTHLPQLAAFGDQHFTIRKHSQEGRTITSVHALEFQDKVEELAQMIGGNNPANQNAARNILEEAAAKKSEHLDK